MRPSLLISRTLPAKVMEAAEADFEVVRRGVETPMTLQDAIHCLESNDAAIPTLADNFSAAAFAEVEEPRCQLLANFGAGYNHIDVKAASSRCISVTNTPGAVTEATADIAMTLILTTARRAIEGDRMVRSGKWTGWHPTQMLGHQVFGKTLGVIGMGRIGRAVARRCHFGFGMKVVFFNRSRIEIAKYPARQLESAEEVAAVSDFVVVSVTGGPASRHLIDESFLSAMRPTAILINTSRGDVINEAALIRALEEGRIAGAGLDVYEFEPKVPEELAKLNNAVLLPHLGTSVLEVREEMGLMALDNVRAYFSGDTPPNLVTR